MLNAVTDTRDGYQNAGEKLKKNLKKFDLSLSDANFIATMGNSILLFIC
jgi:hypothetical protein